MPGKNGQTLSLLVRLDNGSGKEAEFLDYSLRQRWNGAELPLKLLPQDKERHKVPPYSRQSFTLYTDIPDGAKWPDLALDVVKRDFDAADFERKLGTTEFPDQYSVVAADSRKQKLAHENSVLSAGVEWVVALKRDDDYSTHVYLKLENIGDFSVSLPNYRYYLRFDGQTYYPLERAGTDTTSLHPGKHKELQLSADVPESVFSDRMELVIVKSVQIDDKQSFLMPAAYFAISGKRAGDFDVGAALPFTVGKDDYAVQVESWERMPWEDQDILSVRLKLINPGTTSLPLPKLKAAFELDGGIKQDAVVAQLDNRIGLEPNGQATLYVYAKIPFTYSVTEAALTLLEPAGEGEGGQEEAGRELVRVNVPISGARMQEAPVAGTHTNDQFGKGWRMQALEPKRYKGANGDLVVVPLIVENQEKRYVTLPRFAGYFLAGDGSAIPTTVQPERQKAGPGGKTVYWFWSKIPKDYPLDDLKLLVGEAVAGASPVPENGTPDAYLNAASFALSAEAKESAGKLSALETYPYTLSIRNLQADFSNYMKYEWTLTFDYELKNDLLPDVPMPKRNIVLEFRNKSGQVLFERSYALENGSKDEPTLKIGKHNEQQVFEDADALRNYDAQEYVLNVYEEFEGYRHLLTSEKLYWGVKSD